MLSKLLAREWFSSPDASVVGEFPRFLFLYLFRNFSCNRWRIAFILSSLHRPHGLTRELRVEVACWHPKRENTLHQLDWTHRNPDVPVLLASHPWYHQHRRELFRWAAPSSPLLCPIRLQQSLSCLKTLIPDFEIGYSSTHLNRISTNLCRSWLQRNLMGGLYIHETSTPVLESLAPREGQQL